MSDSRAQAALRFAGVAKRYGEHAALAEVSFEVMPGESFGLAGVNGAGKTTLIKCLLDLTAPDAGEISIFGVVAGLHSARARLAYLPERFMPPHYLNGREFLGMMAGLRGGAYDDEAARRMLDRLDLDTAALAKPVRDYSKGMTQKLGLAACFMADCDLLILDEPMSGLDPKARARVKHLLSEWRGKGRTLFFTSHALADIEEICERLAVLHGGQLRYLGAPLDLVQQSGASNLESAFLATIGESIAAHQP
ncbi:MAG: ABC transporter ATP-binding protein [Burkholderiales bacterium]